MTMARGDIVDSSVTPYYHCISRCVRQTPLCGKGNEHRKQWIEDRLHELAGIFAIDVCGYAVMDNHLHVVLKLNDKMAANWSHEQVVRRWSQLFPPRGKNRKPLEVTDAWVKDQVQDSEWVAERRVRLNNLGWFMKCLKEPLARQANQEDACRGHFWDSRFKSIAILDDEALLTTVAYVDLNPLAAGAAETPEDSLHTSVRARIEHCRKQGTLHAVVDQPKDRTRHDRALEDESYWLVPIEDRRERGGRRAGLSPHMNLAGYLRLLDWSSRMFRPGKARVPREVAGLLDRLGSSAELWCHRLQKLQARDRIFGTVFSTRRAAIDHFAASRGVSRLVNVNGCPS